MRPETNDPRLVLKATPARLLKSALVRSRLTVAEGALDDVAVITVQAPAGFGKTLLLGQWRREWLQRGAVVAWLSLDERDDAAVLIQGLELSIRLASGQAPFASSFGVEANSGYDNAGLTDWLARVSSLAAEVVLILDDAHTLPEQTVKNSLPYLLLNAPANLRVIVASRTRLPLPLADLAAHGQFRSFATDDLRLTLPETAELLTARFGTRIDYAACMRLHETTEGWPLGLQLAISAIEKSPDLNAAARSLSSLDGSIERYFVDSMLSRMAPCLIDFLVRIAVVDAICPDLAHTLTGRADARELLAALQTETPILAVSDDGEWSRFHALARGFLLDRFAQLPEVEQSAVRRRAADWLSARGSYELAAEQAFAAHDNDTAFALIEKCLHDVALQGREARVLEWADRFPMADIEKYPRLRMAVAWAIALGERTAEATRLVEPILDDPAQDIKYRREAAAIAAGQAIFAEQSDRLEALVAEWFSDLQDIEPELFPIVANVTNILAVYRGNPEQCRYAYKQQAPRLNSCVDSSRGWRDWTIGLSYFWEGRVTLAEASLHASLMVVEHHLGRRSQVAGMQAAILAGSLWELDRCEEAALLLTDRLDVVERASAPEAIIVGYRTAARLAVQAGQEQRAFDLLERLYTLGEVRAMPRVVAVALLEQVRLHISSGRLESCEELMQRRQRLITEESLKRNRLISDVVRIHLSNWDALLAAARHDWARAREFAAQGVAIAESLRRGRELVQLRLLKAIALMRTGEPGGEEAMIEAVSLAESFGLKRMLIETHPDIALWMARKCRLPTEAPAPVVSAERTPAPRVPRVAPSSLLTPKEREVLEFLAGDMSNKQIASAIDVSEETVKWHMKNLFAKLGAGTRKHVLGRARMLGILEIS